MIACARRSSIESRVGRDHRFERAARGLQIARAAEDLGTRPVRGGQIGVDGQRPAHRLLGGGRSPEARERERAGRVRIGSVGRRRAQLLQLPTGILEPAQPQQQLGGEQAGVRVARIDGQRRARLHERVGFGVPMDQRRRQIEVGFGEVFVEGQRRPEPLLGARPVAAAHRDQAQPVFRLREPRLELQRQREVARRPIQLAAAQRLHARRLQRERARLEAPGSGRAPDRDRREPERPGSQTSHRPVIGPPRRSVAPDQFGHPRAQRTVTSPVGEITREIAPSRSVRSTRVPRSA